MAKADNTVLMENVRIIFRNFAGREGMYNREGDRNFCVLLDKETADQMAIDGWNVKVLKARDEDEDEQPYLQVSVNFKGRPPRVVMITSRGRTTLHEDEVELLDWADIRMVDMIIRPYEWAVNGKTGIKAYLQSIFVTIDEDELELKYSDVEDADSKTTEYVGE
ncbi:MAG: hypothetical protein LC687_06280 [Actinobacteria bacterium]|nr:hypothetical protein [Actinomycetota bacterium]